MVVGGFYMKNKKDAFKEMIEFIKIEKKLGKETITKEEVELVVELADNKRYPRAEYVLAIMYLKGYGVSKDKEMAINYLDRSSKRTNRELQLKIIYTYLCET